MPATALRPRFTVEQTELGFRDAFRDSLRANIAEAKGVRMPFMEWALKAPEPKAGVLNFDAFPMQRELYQQGSDEREWCIMKSTQVGVSAWAVRWAIYHTDLRGMTGLYVFPTLSDVYDFSDARIKTVIDASKYLRARVLPDDPQNKGLKKIGLGFIYFRGSESKRKLDSVDADHLVLDEYDTLAQDNIPDAERRLSGPLSKGLIRRLGVPSIPNWGIAKKFEESDQRRWFVKCEACNEWQPLAFHDNVDQSTAQIVCKACTRPLDVRRGEWVAAHPDRSVRGYHVTRLIAPTANIAKIVEQSQKRAPGEKQVFWNKDLGEPYAPAEGRLSLEAIQAAQRSGYVQVPGYVGVGPVTMGVDVASTRALNVRISLLNTSDDTKHALFIGEVEDFNELERLMGRYDVNMAVIDHLPEGRLARSFAEKFPGLVFLCAFKTGIAPQDAKVIEFDEEMRFIKVRRTEAMDAVSEMIRSQRNHLPLDLPVGYVDAMQAPVRIVEDDPLGRKSVTYRSMGADDYFMAELYDLIASEAWWFRQVRDDQRRDEMRPLEEMLEFQRSNLGDPSADDGYSPGGRDDDDYYAGRDRDGY
jgi:hypothetical protein